MQGFIDESIRGDDPSYFLGCVLVLPEDAEPARDRLRGWGNHARPFHWRNETPIDRRRMVDLIAGLPLGAVVVSTSGFDLRRQARARARCIVALLADLGDGVDDITFDRRGDAADGADRRTILAAQRSVGAATGVRYRFIRSREDPLLWAADAVCGAVGDQYAGGHGDAYGQLAPVLDEITLP